MANNRERKDKRKRDDKMAPAAPVMTADQRAVTKWLRRNLPTKKTKFMHSHVVEYFAGSKAVDKLLSADSPFARENVKDAAAFCLETRDQCSAYLDELLKHKMFHRAKKIPVSAEQLRKKKQKKDGEPPESSDAKKKRRKRKIRLDMHLDQVFVDASDAYVWIFDPTPWYYWAGGGAIVLATIALCLFPLWPPWTRLAVHYASIGAAGFLLLIIGLGIVKYVLFAALFALSAGHLKFWIFPNLTEDVGFVESFVPVYDYTYVGKAGKKKKKKDKDSDNEDEEDEEDDDSGNDENDNGDSSDNDSKRGSSPSVKDFEIVGDTDS